MTTTPWRRFNIPDRRTRAASPDAAAPPAVRATITVRRGELTCTACGETFGAVLVADGAPYCWRCGGHEGVPTVAYLLDGEYEVTP